MKKASLFAAAALLALAVPLTAARPKKQAAAGQKLKVITTIFPAYDWVRQIAGSDAGQVELTLLLDNGVDLHSYQPSVQDIATISTADVFVYVGGESDQWVKDVLRTARNKNLTAVSLLDALGDAVKEEEVVEGMQAEEEDEDEAEGPEYDEHVWLSLRNARALTAVLADVLCQKDAAHAAAYRTNAAAYTARLDALDAEYTAAAAAGRTHTLLFGDRFPFRYLVDDYGLTYYAAFVGCSAETEASFRTIAFLARKLDELALPCVCTIEGSDGTIARTILQNSTSKQDAVRRFDSMQAVTARDVKNGATYLGIMQQNLSVLKAALQ